jgi:hypothetical protein
MTPLLRRTLCALAIAGAALPVTTALAQAPAGTFPEIRVGDPAVDGRRITPGTYTLRMIASRGDQEVEVGTITEDVRVTAGANGEAVLERAQTVQARFGTLTDSVAMRLATLAPIRHRSHNPQRVMRLDFDGKRITGDITPVEGEATKIDEEFDIALFDSSPIDLIIRALPLEEGYGARIPTFIHEMGGKVVFEARVLRAETVEVSDGRKVDAWVVESGRNVGPTSTYWIAKDTRELLRQVTSQGPGVELRFVR